jgi:hypothetical protein
VDNSRNHEEDLPPPGEGRPPQEDAEQGSSGAEQGAGQRRKENPKGKGKAKTAKSREEKLAWFDIQLGPMKMLPIDALYAVADRGEVPAKFEELVQSLMALKEMLQPVIVRWNEEARKGQVIAGKRRLLAAYQARIRHRQLHPQEPEIFTEVPCREVTSPPRPGDDIVIARTENVVRLEERPIDTARSLKELKEQSGLKNSELAERYGLSRGTVTELLGAAEMPEEWLQKAEDRVELRDGKEVTIKGKELFKLYRQYKAEMEAKRNGTGSKGAGTQDSPGDGGAGTENVKEAMLYKFKDRTTGLQLTTTKKKAVSPAAAIRVLEGWLHALKSEEGGTKK